MSELWDIYEELLRAKNILGNSPRYTSQESLNDDIDAAFKILDNSLPQLRLALEEVEETE